MSPRSPVLSLRFDFASLNWRLRCTRGSAQGRRCWLWTGKWELQSRKFLGQGQMGKGQAQKSAECPDMSGNLLASDLVALRVRSEGAPGLRKRDCAVLTTLNQFRSLRLFRLSPLPLRLTLAPYRGAGHAQTIVSLAHDLPAQPDKAQTAPNSTTCSPVLSEPSTLSRPRHALLALVRHGQATL